MLYKASQPGVVSYGCMLLQKSEKELFLVLSHCFGFSGPLEPGALTVDLEAAERALDQLLAIPWIKESVTLYFCFVILTA